METLYRTVSTQYSIEIYSTPQGFVVYQLGDAMARHENAAWAEGYATCLLETEMANS